MKYINLFLSIWISIYAFAGTIPQEKSVKIIITPNHSNWEYTLGEKVFFNLAVQKNGVLIPEIELSYQYGPEMQKPIFESMAFLQKGELTVDAGTLTEPGFLRIQASIKIHENEFIEGICTVAFQPEEIKPTVEVPSDFESFWNEAKMAKKKIPLNTYFELQQDQCTADVNVYHISFQTYNLNSRIYGWLAVPKKDGKYPAIIDFPGAGVWKKQADTYTASKGFITLNIFIHGIPLTMPDSIYDILKYSALNQYYLYGIDNANNYYYKRVIVGCNSAIDFIYQLPQFDGINLGVTGQSQGGALSIITASLDKRVKALVAFHPALCDITGYLYGRAGGWPGVFKNYHQMNPEEINLKRKVTAYYDVVNFAKNISQPIYLSGGYNDMVCSPTSYYSAFNSIKSPKSIHIYKETGHWLYPQQQSSAQEWLMKMLQ